MANKPTYEELEQRVKELGQAEFRRKQAEEVLRENEEKIQAILDASPDVIHLIDINGILLTSKQELCKNSGLRDR